jgi:hypothetical protein
VVVHSLVGQETLTLLSLKSVGVRDDGVSAFHRVNKPAIHGIPEAFDADSKNHPLTSSPNSSPVCLANLVKYPDLLHFLATCWKRFEV